MITTQKNLEKQLRESAADNESLAKKVSHPGLPDGLFSTQNPNLGKFWRACEW
jgi:hypothetical protein